jgi:predicted phage terminase large subunit-like protein
MMQRVKQALVDPSSIEAELCRRSLFYFMQTFWHIICPDEPIWNWHIPYLCGKLEADVRRIGRGEPKVHDTVINVPPGTTKSITASIMLQAWSWTVFPWFRWICGSYSMALSLAHSTKCRDIVRSELYKTLFPYLAIKFDSDAKSDFQLVQITDEGIEVAGGRLSTSVGGGSTGWHAHAITVDDALNPLQAASEVELKNANEWITQTLSTRKVDKAVTPIFLIMQRLHENDPTGHLLDRKDNVDHICLPGENRSKDFDEKAGKEVTRIKPPELVKHYVGDLLDPYRLDWPVLEELEADLGQYGFAGQILQSPTPPSGGMFKVKNFQIIDQLPAEVNFVETARYWDKAGTQDGGCYTVGCKIVKLKNGKYIVLDVVRGQWSAEIRERIIKQTAQTDGIAVQQVIEQEGGSGGKESAEATVINLAGFSIHKDRPVGNKIFRADTFSVQVNAGNVMLLRGEWIKAFVKELAFFPFGKYKDQVDAAAGAFQRLVGKRRAQAR